MGDFITLAHGDGGKATHQLIDELFISTFHNKFLSIKADSALVDINNQPIAFTTDSFVVEPLFFECGDIGK